MPSRFTPAKRLILLPCIVYCASCAPLPQTCIRCSLSCDGAPDLKTHSSVHVLVEQHSHTLLDEIHTVSSLCEGERCSVPGCFQKDSRYSVKIYSHDNAAVPKVLVDKTDLQPDCVSEGISDSDRSSPDDADMNRCTKLLILLTFCLWIFTSRD